MISVKVKYKSHTNKRIIKYLVEKVEKESFACAILSINDIKVTVMTVIANSPVVSM